MKLDLEELERKARAATPGPWTANMEESGPGLADVVYDDNSGDLYEICTEAVESNGEHIAANSPPVTLALIARIRELEAAYRRIIEDNFSELDTLSERELLDKGTVMP